MNKDMILGLIRHLFTTAGGALVAKGVLDAEDSAQVTGALVTLIGVAWSIYQKRSSAQPKQPAQARLFLPLLLPVCLGITGLTGCASFRTEQIDESTPDGQRKITTITKARTFFDSKSALAQLKASQTDKTQSLGVGSLAQESSGTNATALAESVTRAVVEAAIKAAAPVP